MYANTYGQTIHVLSSLTVGNPHSGTKLDFVQVYQNNQSTQQTEATDRDRDRDRGRDKQVAQFPGPSWIFSGCILRETSMRGNEIVIKETFVPLEAVIQLKGNIEFIDEALERSRPHEVRRQAA